tara:strand:- start:247 stop:429 length:183 start_codon:yes stop_codon:yes gene_type:complete
MEQESKDFSPKLSETVSKRELNEWKRGFTPQAEIWNGRMAIIGLFLLGAILVASNLLYGS